MQSKKADRGVMDHHPIIKAQVNQLRNSSIKKQ